MTTMSIFNLNEWGGIPTPSKGDKYVSKPNR